MNPTLHESLSETEQNNYAWQKFALWRDVTKAQWHDWRWQYQNLLTTPDDLLAVFPELQNEIEAVRDTLTKYKFSVTPYYASLINPKDPLCPIRLQALPDMAEMDVDASSDVRDPLAEDRDMPVPGLVHRYPDRVLFLITEVCSLYCRYCTRRRVILEQESHIDRHIDEALEYIREHTEIRDVIISGGDALVVGEKLLKHVISTLRSISHVEIIRLGTRIPVVCPMRFNDDLIGWLKQFHPIYVMTHFNHPFEITPEARACLNKLADNGFPVYNQAVLLRHVNSCAFIQKKLGHELLKNRVRPYYLYQCDLSEGIGHFRTPVSKGIEIIEAMRGHTSGLAVPTFVVDLPDGGGKVPVMPQYVVSQAPQKVVLRNFRGKFSVYQEPDENDCHCSTTELYRQEFEGKGSTGVADLLGDRLKTLNPEPPPKMNKADPFKV